MVTPCMMHRYVKVDLVEKDPSLRQAFLVLVGVVVFQRISCRQRRVLQNSSAVRRSTTTQRRSLRSFMG